MFCGCQVTGHKPIIEHTELITHHGNHEASGEPVMGGTLCRTGAWVGDLGRLKDAEALSRLDAQKARAIL